MDIESGNIVDIDFDSLVPAIPKILSDWRENVQIQLDDYLSCKLSRTSCPAIPPETRISDLVVAHFLYCRNCLKFVMNEGVMPAIHDCRSALWELRERFKKSKDPLARAMGRWQMKRWYPERYRVKLHFIYPVLRACGKNHLATVQELDKLDPGLICELDECKLSGHNLSLERCGE